MKNVNSLLMNLCIKQNRSRLQSFKIVTEEKSSEPCFLAIYIGCYTVSFLWKVPPIQKMVWNSKKIQTLDTDGLLPERMIEQPALNQIKFAVLV